MKIKMLCVIFCCTLILNSCSNKSSDELPQETIAKTPIEIMSVTKSLIQNEYVYSGKVKPENEVNVLSMVSGKVKEVKFDIGDKVNEGDILFVMDTTDIINNINVLKASLVSTEANIKSAKTSLDLVNGSSMQLQIENAQSTLNNASSALDNAKLNLSNAEIGVNNAKLSFDTVNFNIENAELAFKNAELGFKNAKTNYENNKVLYEANSISKNAFEQYETAYTQAEIGYSQAQLAYNQTKLAYSQAELAHSQAEIAYKQTELGYNQAEKAYEQAKNVYDITVNQMPSENKRKAEDALNIAQSSKQSILAQIASAEKTLNDATVKSPITGIVTACNVKTNTILSQGATVPFTIIDMDNVNIEVSVSEQIINNLSIDQEVDVKITAVSDMPINGSISTINPAANSSNTYDITILINNSDYLLKSGMFGEVYFTREKSDNAIVLPRNCVISKNEEDYVMIEENGIVKKVVVTLGVDNGNEIEILEGLEEGMNIVTKGQSYLSDGDNVEIVSNEKGA